MSNPTPSFHTMNFLSIPKLLQWTPGLSQQYSCPQKILVTSGCSFTSSTLQLDTAASWPGYIVDRCRFGQGIDYSYPGADNEYIGDSILYHFDQVPDSEIKKYMVIIMWTRIATKTGLIVATEKIISNDVFKTMHLGNTIYERITDNNNISSQEIATQSVKKMLEVFSYLKRRKISFVFTIYSNIIFPPFSRWSKAFYIADNVDSLLLTELQSLPWIPLQHRNFLCDYAFENNYLSEDGFHPTVEGNLFWTDNILLPSMQKQNLIASI
jgi:hypothetical protein